MSEAKSNKFFYNAEDFVPFSCHYDNETILTKNGELLKTFMIDGIGLNPIPPQLSQLRQRVRNTLQKNLNLSDVACWIHTSRRRENLDDELPYPNIVSEYIHDIWVKKNYWHDKFCNKLYITLVFSAQSIGSFDFKEILRNINFNKLSASHDQYLQNAKAKLDFIQNNILEDLKDFYPKKLGIIYKDEEAYCEILSFFFGALRGIESSVKVAEISAAKLLGDFDYSVGLDKMEVLSDSKRKYLGILSIKEYQNISEQYLEPIIQLPVEFIISEVFYFIDAKDAHKNVAIQIKTAELSKDKDLLRFKQLDHFIASGSEENMPYCSHQISFMLLNDNLDKLDHDICTVSNQLGRVGLLHVKEDVAIEYGYWSQIPGNFKFLKRLKPIPLSHVGAFATLHNTACGFNDIGWGRYITLLRTKQGTPYFFNFHALNKNARLMIAGMQDSGKSTISNFVISEALKFKPKVLKLVYDNFSYVFAHLNGMKWINGPISIDFFKINSIRDNRVIIKAFFTQMAGLDSSDVAEDALIALNNLVDFFFSMELEQRSYMKINQFDFSSPGAAKIKKAMQDYLEGGQYYKYFIDDDKWNNELTEMSVIDFSSFSDKNFKKEHYPSEDRFLPEYYAKLKCFAVCREILTSATLIKFRDTAGETEKCIINHKDMNISVTMAFGKEYYDEYFKIFASSNIAIISEVDLIEHDDRFLTESWNSIRDSQDIKIFMSAELFSDGWRKKLALSDQEFKILRSILVASRLFFVTEKDYGPNLLELSIGGFKAILNILSSEQEIIEKYQKFAEEADSLSREKFISFYKSLEL
ncbi:MAG: hypothetical protein SFT68_02910 [Rickettsiaceae bacterium]|nr:hypothetical protein [Rickettsiaceae bacterium]